ncbi:MULTISPECIES: acyl carrier protein [unclassified Streptomyces]|uniref:acyl carrier protein n=1 Tax=unclassified Streptomyces TaxID=2593676 RepID=UPI00278C77F8|nr:MULTISPECIES: acyl carrier protein [unclassified Streptomyces]
MSDSRFTLDDLKRILREGAGADEETDLDADILDTEFELLGYDSLALLETGSRIELAYGVVLDEAVLPKASTPRAFIDLVNSLLPTDQPA